MAAVIKLSARERRLLKRTAARREAQERAAKRKSAWAFIAYCLITIVVAVIARHALNVAAHAAEVSPLAAYANGASLIDRQVDQMTK